MKQNKHIHFVGIKGVGMAPLAIIAKEAGFIVTGCDLDEVFITDEVLEKAQIDIKTGFSVGHLEGVDLLITTGAHGGFDHPEVRKAKEMGIIIWTQGQAVGEFMKGEIFGKNLKGIAVSGTHGKTTTTAMIASILKDNRLDPSFLVGTGNIPFLDSSGHFGKGEYFVAEADEYATEPKYDLTPKLLWQKPYFAVITNIELDHPDLYASVEDLYKAFLAFSQNIAVNGGLVLNIDDEITRRLSKNVVGHVVTYGFSKDADFYVDRIHVDKEKMYFWINNKETSLGEFSLNVTGDHNALNALAAIVIGLELGLSLANIKSALTKFHGTRRRFEYIKDLENGAILYDDYAHHPTEIKSTLQAFKKTFPNKKILCIFQPHTYSRTKKLFDQFKYSLSFADEVIVTDIYSSAREEKDDSVSSQMLVNEIAKIFGKVKYIENLPNVVKYVNENMYNSDWVILTMGAGNIYKISEELK